MHRLNNHPRVKKSLVAALVVGGLAVLMLMTHAIWLRWIGHYLVVADPLHKADAVIVLGGGGPERTWQGVKLMTDGYADWYIVTNAPLDMPGIRDSYADLMIREAVWAGLSEDRILTAPGLVESTVAEARAARRLAEERGFRSLIIVSDSFHTRRARLIFQDEFKGSGIRISVRPAEQSQYDPDRWWKTSEGLNTTWNEYAKLIVFWLGYR
jgi:uncharacterized SAM-binding protein YcdF (DUF218 family)